MSDSQSVLGFTEAELGFFLVLLFIVLWAVTAKATPVPPPAPPSRKQELASITQDSLKALQTRLKKLQHDVDSLRSPIWPSCISRGLSAGPLLTVDVIGNSLFRVGNDTIELDGLAERTASARSRATAAECREEVRFRVRRDLTAAESEEARRSIGLLGLRIVSGSPIIR